MRNNRKTFLPFSKPCIGKDEIKAITECLSSGWITAGPGTARFESAFAKYVGTTFALSLTSGTAALDLGLTSLNLKPGDEVITPSLTWLSGPNMIVLKRAKPVFVDVNVNTRNIDIEQVEKAISPRTKAIIPVHFAGQPCDLDPLLNICKKHGIALIEDAAHAAGCEYKKRKIGSIGDLAIFSFHPIKNLTTAEGGMVTTRNEQLAARIKLLRWHGVNKDPWKRNKGIGTARYDTIEPGWKYNFTDLQASLGLVQLNKLNKMNEQRRRLAMHYQKLLSDTEGIALPKEVTYPHKHSWHLYTVLVETEKIGITRDDFMEHLKARNVGTGLHFLAVHKQSFYQKNFPVKLPNTEYISERIMSLPLFPDMTEHDVVYVVEAIKDVIKEYGRRN